MTNPEREIYLAEVNRKITRLLEKKFPDQPRIDALRLRRDQVLADYIAADGEGWFGNA